jgi:hypothetical protein
MALPEFLNHLAWFLIVVAALKIIGSYLLHSNSGSALGAGIAWFVPGLA